MAYGSNFSIGNLRFRVTLCTRQETPDSTTGIAEKYINQFITWANITPVGLQTWVGAQQIVTPITHRIVIRYDDGHDMFDVILRDLNRPDGTVRHEVYRIRRMADFEGRQRYTVFDVELEHAN